MFEKFSPGLLRLALSAIALAGIPMEVLAKDPIEAAQDLSGVSQTDPNGFTLMIVSICMLFTFALTLIIATSIHVFKKSPSRHPSHRVQRREEVGSTIH